MLACGRTENGCTKWLLFRLSPEILQQTNNMAKTTATRQNAGNGAVSLPLLVSKQDVIRFARHRYTTNKWSFGNGLSGNGTPRTMWKYIKTAQTHVKLNILHPARKVTTRTQTNETFSENGLIFNDISYLCAGLHAREQLLGCRGNCVCRVPPSPHASKHVAAPRILMKHQKHTQKRETRANSGPNDARERPRQGRTNTDCANDELWLATSSGPTTWFA